MPITDVNGATTTAENLNKEIASENTDNSVLSEEEKKKQFAYTEDLKKEENKQKMQEKATYPMNWKKQAIVSVSTTAIAFIPIALKIYNSKKDPNYPSLSYADVLDLIIYKAPDAYVLLEQFAIGSKYEKFIVGTKLGWMFKKFAPAFPSIMNIVKQYKTKGTVEFDSQLTAHLTVFVLNSIIPWVMSNKYINYVFDKLFAGSIENFIVTYLIRSNNPLLREIGHLIPLGSIIANRAKNVIDYVSQDSKVENPKYPDPNQKLEYGYTQQKPVNYSQGLENKSSFEKLIDKIADTVGVATGVSGSPYQDPYYYDRYRYGSSFGNGVWGGDRNI